MKNYFTLALLSLFCICISCEETNEDPMTQNEEEEMNDAPDCSSESELSLELVTGIKFFDEAGAAIGQVGNPNVTDDQAVKIFPNPSNGNLFISKDSDDFYTFYLFPCQKDTTCNDLDYSTFEFDYSEEKLGSLSGVTFGLESQNLQTQLGSEYEAGYYKMVFVPEGEGKTIVHNTYIDFDKSPNEIIAFLGGEF